MAMVAALLTEHGARPALRGHHVPHATSLSMSLLSSHSPEPSASAWHSLSRAPSTGLRVGSHRAELAASALVGSVRDAKGSNHLG